MALFLEFSLEFLCLAGVSASLNDRLFLKEPGETGNGLMSFVDVCRLFKMFECLVTSNEDLS